MKQLLILLIICCSFSNSFGGNGIYFETGLSWAQIKEKAKKENKYIFIDGYTTWCIPCKMMANQIFPQDKVADFFNANFINVAVQFDVTKKDNLEIKKWYKEALNIQKAYNVDVYPTYLFFTPQGELAHTITGGSETADEFLANSKKALDPATQYNLLKKQFDAGKRTPDFLLTLSRAATRAGDGKSISTITNAYLQTQKDLLTAENIKFIMSATHKSTDPGFKVLRDNSQKVDSVSGRGQSDWLVNNIVFDELVFPYLKKNPVITYYNGGMVMYGGDLNKDVNWGEVKSKLDNQYPNLSERILLSSKLRYFEWSRDWKNYTTDAYLFATKYRKEEINEALNSYAHILFSYSNDSTCLNTALGWVKKSLDVEDIRYRMYYTGNYANLLYKTGKKDEAIDLIQKVIAYYKDTDGMYAKRLEQMKKGEKTWIE
jgi:thioredoxin-related protein